MSKLENQTEAYLKEGDIIRPTNNIIFDKEVSSLFRINGVELAKHNFTKLFGETFTIIRETEIDKAIKLIEDSGKYIIKPIPDGCILYHYVGNDKPSPEAELEKAIALVKASDKYDVIEKGCGYKGGIGFHPHLGGGAEGGKPIQDDWIPWTGGERPVDGETIVEVKWNTQEVGLGKAFFLRWEHWADKAARYIIAYRVVSQDD